jgi:outer membrane murein-binding lipoprotein Lpp
MSIPSYPDEMFVNNNLQGYGKGISPLQINVPLWEKTFPDIVQRKPFYVATNNSAIDIAYPRRVVLFDSTVTGATLALGTIPGDFFEFQNNTDHSITITVAKSDQTTVAFALAAGKFGSARFNGTDWELTPYNIYSLKTYIDDKVTELGGVNSGQMEEISQAIEDANELITTANGEIDTLQSEMTQAKSDIESLQGDMSTALFDISAAESTLDTLGSTVSGLDTTVSRLEEEVAGLGSGLSASGDGNDPEYREASARSLLTVLNVQTVAAAFAALSTRCNGTGNPDFSNLRIGDYIDLTTGINNGTSGTDGLGNLVWNDTYKNLRLVIAGFNTYHNVGDTQNTKNHILFMFRHCIAKHRMAASNDNSGGFAKPTELYTILNGTFKTALITAMGGTDYIYPIRVAHSTKGSYSWQTYSVWVPTEPEVFGFQTWGDELNSYNTNVQFPIFQKSYEYRIKNFDGSRWYWWESTPSASIATYFCFVADTGLAHYSTASYADVGVSPCFAIS